MSYPIQLLIILTIAFATLAWKIITAIEAERNRTEAGQKKGFQNSEPRQARDNKRVQPQVTSTLLFGYTQADRPGFMDVVAGLFQRSSLTKP